MSRTIALCRLGAVLSALALTPTPARAADPDTDSAARLAEAKGLFRRGVALLRAGDTERALEAFQRSRELVPSGKNSTNAAICLERLGRYDEALEMYEEVLTRFAADLDDDDRQSLAPVMANLRQKIGYLELLSNVDGLVVVDGRARGRLPLAAALRLLPGKRELRILKDGYRTFERSVEVKAGEPQTLDAKLEPLAGVGAVRVEAVADTPLDVFIDGERVGRTPFEHTLRGGPHVLRAEGERLGTAPAVVRIEEGKTLTVHLNAQALGGTVLLSSHPASARLFLGEVPLDTSSWRGRLPLGSYDLFGREAGYFDGKARFTSPPSGASLAVRVDLPKNSADPRWPSRWKLRVGATLGPWFAPTLAAGSEQLCPSLCAKSRSAWGAFGALLVGVRHENGFGAELLVGFAGYEQRFTRALFQPFTDGSEPQLATIALDQHSRATGPLAAVRGDVRLPTAIHVDFWSALGLGALLGSYRAEVSGAAWTTGDSVAVGGSPATRTSVSPFVSAALGAERKLGALGFRAALGFWFFPTLGPELGGPRIGVGAASASSCSTASVGDVSCLPDSDALAHERAHGRFWAVTPELGAHYTF